MAGSDNKGDGLASQPRRYRVPGQPLLNRHQVRGVSRSPDGLFAQQEREPIRGRPAVRGKKTHGGRPGQGVEEHGTWASQKHSEAGYGRPVDRGAWTAQTVKRPPQQPAHPQYANYWAPLTRKRHTMPHSAQPQHTNYWAPRTRKRHQQEHRPQQPPEGSNPTQHAKGRTGDRPGPHKGATTRRNVTQGGLGGWLQVCGRGLLGPEAMRRERARASPPPPPPPPFALQVQDQALSALTSPDGTIGGLLRDTCAVGHALCHCVVCCFHGLLCVPRLCMCLWDGLTYLPRALGECRAAAASGCATLKRLWSAVRYALPCVGVSPAVVAPSSLPLRTEAGPVRAPRTVSAAGVVGPPSYCWRSSKVWWWPSKRFARRCNAASGLWFTRSGSPLSIQVLHGTACTAP